MLTISLETTSFSTSDKKKELNKITLPNLMRVEFKKKSLSLRVNKTKYD